MQEKIIKATIASLKSIRQKRFYMTERGYQGRFYCALQKVLDDECVLHNGIILEMEYQKGSVRHDMSQRPDIILHIPTEHSGASIHDNNFSVWALKHHKNRQEAEEDFRKLDEMFHLMQYPLGFFIVINSDHHMLDQYKGNFKDRIHSFAVKLDRESIVIRHAYFNNGQLRVDDEIA